MQVNQQYLVNELVNQGQGSSTIIPDDDPQMNAKVIKALSIASKPAFTNISFDWGSNSSNLMFSVPEAPHTPNVFEEEPFHVFAILKEEGLKEGKVAVTLFNTSEQTEATILIDLDPAAIIETAEGHNFQLSAKNRMEWLDRFRKEDKKSADAEVEELSIKYSVLCDKIAFFGKVKNKDKAVGEMETIKIPIKK